MAKGTKRGTKGKPVAPSDKRAASPDKLTRTAKKEDVELTENDLKAVSGGSLFIKF